MGLLKIPTLNGNMEALEKYSLQSSISDPGVSGLFGEACDIGEKLCRCQTPSIGT